MNDLRGAWTGFAAGVGRILRFAQNRAASLRPQPAKGPSSQSGITLRGALRDPLGLLFIALLAALVVMA